MNGPVILNNARELLADEIFGYAPLGGSEIVSVATVSRK